MDIYGVPVTPEQLARMEADEAELRAKRAAARRRVVLRTEDTEGAVNCATCTWITDFNAEHRRGWCSHLRFMVSSAFMCRCGTYIRDN